VFWTKRKSLHSDRTQEYKATSLNRLRRVFLRRTSASCLRDVCLGYTGCGEVTCECGGELVMQDFQCGSQLDQQGATDAVHEHAVNAGLCAGFPNLAQRMIACRPSGFVILALASLFILQASPALSDSLIESDISESNEISQAAQEGFRMFLPRAEAQKKSYGFETNDIVSEAVLKPPVELFILDEKRVLAYQSGQSVESLLKPTGQWFVPVAIGGSNRAMIQVTQTAEHKWSGTGWGWSPLARGWQMIETWWPASGKFTPLLIISPQMSGYYFTVPQVPPANLTPFVNPNNAVAARDGTPPVLETARQTVQMIQNVLEQREKEPRSQTQP